MNEELHRGKLNIYQATSNRDDHTPVVIQLDDAANGVRIGQIEIDALTFFNAVRGRGYVDCVFSLDTSRVGKLVERKTVEVYLPFGNYSTMKAQIRAAVAEYEQDGWMGYDGDCGNHHRVVRQDKDGAWYKVAYIRYVDPPQA